MYSFDTDPKANPIMTKHEDIIWAIRQSTEKKRNREDYELAAAASMIQFHIDSRFQIRGSVVPDEVILDINNYIPRQFNGSVLFGAITGFSKISDIYNKPMKGGPIQVTKVLNQYFGGMIEEVLAYEGDVLYLSPELILVIWKTYDESPPNDEVHAALNCALSIQKSCGHFEAEGVPVKVKLTVTAGVLLFSLIGDQESTHFICVGRPIDDITEAQQKCADDEIVAAPSAWMYVNMAEYLAVETEDGAHFKIFGIGPNWHITRKDYMIKRESQGIRSVSISDEEMVSDDSFQVGDPSLRPILHKALMLQHELNKFVNVQMLDALEEEEPIERLIEMRHVVVMVVNIVVKKGNLRATVGVVDQCFKLINKQARQHNGVILRLLMFNKDITFLIIFGLRGFTKISECKQALICSSKCQHFLNLIENVQSVSIACTSGKLYCGIFGHNLRKKYDVFGTCIYKATKMMTAYPDRVTCDRTVFLHSQLEANNFFLMDYKRLEGIINQGVIYEYNANGDGDTKGSVLMFPLNDHTNCPILGRDSEVRLFQKLFNSFVKYFRNCSSKNAVLIEAYPKEGKSRLLLEFVEMAKDIKCYEIILEKNDYLNVYGGVKKIIEPFLKIHLFSSAGEKENVIKSSMRISDKDEFICSLNEVFDVHFPVSKEYNELTNNEKREVLTIRIQKLCKWCFKKPTLISIDNADLMDEESLNLIPAMLETKTFFLAAVFNKIKGERSNLMTISDFSEIARMPLKEIPKIYQAGIACQIIGIYAIPADLENTIQKNSNGNPGWIENFMITLIQSKKVFIKSLDIKKIHESGLVAPPLYMLRRLSPEQINQYKILLEEKDENDDITKLDQWSVFIDSCRDEHANVDIREQVYRILCIESEVRVCFMTHTFNVALDVDSEISDDMKILELYDGMSYQEQQLLSCASVLGDLFTRNLLRYLWSPESEELAGIVVQQLFEKRVLCCARGDFSSGGEYILQRNNKIDPSKDKAIDCYCIGMDMDDSCIAMPTYASCGYMRFRSNKFRMIVYEVIPDNQRREMHNRAAKYIQKETRRCVSCGSSYFPDRQICRLDTTPIYGLSDKRDNKKKTQLQQMNFEELFDYSNVRSTVGSGSTKDARQSVIPSFRASSVMKSYTSSLRGSGFRVDQHSSLYVKIPNWITPLTILRLKNCTSLIRTFSKSNFVSCECHLILGHMHKRLKYHFRESGQWSKMIKSCISLTKLCIRDENYSSALGTIAEAQEILGNNEYLVGKMKWKRDMFLGVLQSLTGRVLVCLDQVNEGYNKFMEAMKTFGVPFPENKRKISFHLKLLKQKWSQKMGLYFLPKFIVEDGDINEFRVMNCMSDTLCHLCRIFIARKDWKLAELAAVWSLRNSLQTETSLQRICDSFQLMLQIAQHYRNKLLMVSLAFHALRYCHKKQNFVEVRELKAVAQLYRRIFEARVSIAEFDSALQMSYIALNLASTSNDTETSIRILTLLPMLLLRKMHLREVVSMMHELEYFTNELDNCWGRMWYYALAVIFHLETGYTFIPFQTLESFYSAEGVNLISQYYMSKMLLIVTMWLWNIRNNYWEAASLLNKEIDEFRKNKVDNIQYACAFIYILEGTLLTFVNKINKRSILGKAETRKEVERLFKKLQKTKSFAPSLHCRLHHLEAYYAFIMNNEEKTKKMLKKAKKLTLKHGLDLELLHLDHSEKAWNKEISAAVRDFWKNHCSDETYISYNDMEYDNIKIYSFTYPPPIFKY